MNKIPTEVVAACVYLLVMVISCFLAWYIPRARKDRKRKEKDRRHNMLYERLSEAAAKR